MSMFASAAKTCDECIDEYKGKWCVRKAGGPANFCLHSADYEETCTDSKVNRDCKNLAKHDLQASFALDHKTCRDVSKTAEL